MEECGSEHPTCGFCWLGFVEMSLWGTCDPSCPTPLSPSPHTTASMPPPAVRHGASTRISGGSPRRPSGLESTNRAHPEALMSSFASQVDIKGLTSQLCHSRGSAWRTKSRLGEREQILGDKMVCFSPQTGFISDNGPAAPRTAGESECLCCSRWAIVTALRRGTGVRCRVLATQQPLRGAPCSWPPGFAGTMHQRTVWERGAGSPGIGLAQPPELGSSPHAGRGLSPGLPASPRPPT